MLDFSEKYSDYEEKMRPKQNNKQPFFSTAKKLYPDDVLITAIENDSSILAVYEHKKYLHQTSLYLREHALESVQLLGTIDLCFHYSDDLSYTEEDFTPYAYISSIDIFRYKGQGLGSFLLQVAKEYCFCLGIAKMIGSISYFDLERQQGQYGEMLIHFYQKNGFRVLDTNNNSKKIEIHLK